MIALRDDWYARGLVATGAKERLEAFRAKRRNGEKIVFGAIGGSITQGAGAASNAECYVSRIGRRLGAETVNAGIGATSSMYGCFRAGQDLLRHRPDLIVVEFAVNDSTNPDVRPSYEGLLRQCLELPNRPLVLAIFTMNRAGFNYQADHVAVGSHYRIPLLSYRDALYPEVAAGRMKWEELSPDEVHPNSIGHGLMADMVIRFLETAAPEESEGAFPAPLDPESLRYAAGRLEDASKIEILRNEGWSIGPHKGHTGFQSETPGAELELGFSGRRAVIGFQKYAGPFGMIEARVDGGEPLRFDGFYEKPAYQAWAGGHTVLQLLAADLPPGEHRLTVRLLPEKHPESGGHRFDIGYLLITD